jgi:hypothetical protein
MIDWEGVAKEFGYDNCKQMLQTLYIDEKRTVRQLVDVIGYSTPTLAKLLNQYGFDIAGNRGKNMGVFVCKFCEQKFPGDVRKVCCDGENCLEKYRQEINDRKYSQRQRLRKKPKPPANKCIMCGKNKGKNRFYCKTCHSIVSNGVLFNA